MVYVVLADGFEEIEAIEPIDILKRCGIEVTTAGVKNRTVTGAHGIPVTADIMIDEVSAEDMDMLILPGGPGHEILDASNEVHGLINEAVVRNAYIAAICAAPSIIGKKGLLQGKKATCFPGYERYLYGAEISGSKVEVAGKIVTAKGAGAAAEFGFALAGLLTDKEAADEVKRKMQY